MSVRIGLMGRGYQVVHCFEHHNQFVQLMYQLGVGDGSFEREAKQRKWFLIEGGDCCDSYRFRSQVNSCGHCGAGVNGNVVYRKDIQSLVD